MGFEPLEPSICSKLSISEESVFLTKKLNQQKKMNPVNAKQKNFSPRINWVFTVKLLRLQITALKKKLQPYVCWDAKYIFFEIDTFIIYKVEKFSKNFSSCTVFWIFFYSWQLRRRIQKLIQLDFFCTSYFDPTLVKEGNFNYVSILTNVHPFLFCHDFTNAKIHYPQHSILSFPLYQ